MRTACQQVRDDDIGRCDDCGNDEGEMTPVESLVVVQGEPVMVRAWLCEACRG